MRKPLPTTAVRKVAVIAHSARSLRRYRGGLMRELAARRHRVLAMAPDVDDAVAAEFGAENIQTAVFPLEQQSAGPFAARRTEKAIGEALKAFDPHVVVASGPRTAMLGAALGRSAGAERVVLVVNGLAALGVDGDAPSGWLQGSGAKRRRKAAIAAADMLVFHNPDDPRTLVAEETMPASKPHVVTAGSGVDLSHYAMAPLPPLAGGLVFVMLARLAAGQGVLTFAEAAAALKPKAQAARFILAGLPSTEPDAVTPQHLARWPGAIEVVPSAADVRPLIAAAHVLVHPSRNEGLPGAVLEGLAMGRPVIASDIPGSRLAIDERVNGVLVPPGDADALAAAMESFLRRPDLIPAMSRASRAKAERLFDERAVIEQMLGALGIA